MPTTRVQIQCPFCGIRVVRKVTGKVIKDSTVAGRFSPVRERCSQCRLVRDQQVLKVYNKLNNNATSGKTASCFTTCFNGTVT